ncbi:MAG: glutamate--tRNA ligase [Candidatus Woesebacteria bacterium]|nr:glutamate--tRNA ligase [Candidatus Woesebacteria bacterium]
MRTRFAPSPTGFLHIGSLRTALYAYLLAKNKKGDFILRIEDTDQKREVEGSVDAICDTLKKFGIEWNEYYVQSIRHKSGIYKKAAEKLILNGHAFYCQCKPKNAKIEGFSNILRDPCRNLELTSGAIKLRVPDNKIVKYKDFVHKKEISWNTDTIYDATLLKSDGFPTYHLAAMTDDIEMKITHILRGHDWLPSTPVHLLVFEYLGGKTPEIGHLTDIMSAETGKKLSKRRDSVFVENFLEEGYLPEALLNFILLLGWAPKDNRELYSLEEMVTHFDINGFQDANPRFFREKLDWFNGQYIRKLSIDSLLEKLKLDKTAKNKAIVKLLQDRIEKLSDFNSLAKFFFDRPKVDTKLFGEKYKEHLKKAIEGIKSNRDLMEVVKENDFKTGNFFMSLRIAVTGMKFTPPINESIEILGKEETIVRLKSLI